MELLEIDSGACILEADRAAYIDKDTKWAERQKLEIPVNAKSLYAVRDKFERLEAGAAPFVVPQGMDDYLTFGLIFDAANDFIL